MPIDVSEYDIVDNSDIKTVPNSADLSPDTESGDFEYACDVCGKEIFYGGRGPKPKKCDEHKRGTAKRPTVSRETKTRKSSGWQAPLGNALINQFVGIGMVVFAINQFDGQVIIGGAPKLAESLIEVAETNTAVRDALEKFCTAGAWAGVATAVATIAIPIMANHNLIPGNIAGIIKSPTPA